MPSGEARRGHHVGQRDACVSPRNGALLQFEEHCTCSQDEIMSEENGALMQKYIEIGSFELENDREKTEKTR